MSAPHKTQPSSCAIVIFGANGDLTKRLIVPALYNLARGGMLPERLALIGIDHNDRTSEQWHDGLRDFLAQSLEKSGDKNARYTRKIVEWFIAERIEDIPDLVRERIGGVVA